MPFHREGVQTNRDSVVTDKSRERLLARLRAFAAGHASSQLEPALKVLRHYDPNKARERVARALGEDPQGARGILLQRLSYRPGDDRWFTPITPLCHRPRPELLACVDGRSPILVTVRKDRGKRPWSHLGVVRDVPDSSWLSTRSSCRTRAFPLRKPDGTPNIDLEVLAPWARTLGREPLSEEVIFYAAAVLSSSTYRTRFDLTLRLDYPRLPPPPSSDAYQAVVDAGRDVAALFLDLTLGGETGDRALDVGHHRIDHANLHRAMTRADAAVAELLFVPSKDPHPC
jgi:hypothetical protein